MPLSATQSPRTTTVMAKSSLLSTNASSRWWRRCVTWVHWSASLCFLLLALRNLHSDGITPLVESCSTAPNPHHSVNARLDAHLIRRSLKSAGSRCIFLTDVFFDSNTVAEYHNGSFPTRLNADQADAYSVSASVLTYWCARPG